MIPNIFNTKQVKESKFDSWAFNWVGSSGEFGKLSMSDVVDGYGQLSINNNVIKWWWDGFGGDASEPQLNYKDNIYYWFAIF